MTFINRQRRFYCVGVDIFGAYLKHCQNLGCYDELIRADIRSLPFKRKSVDVIISMEVLEHLDRKDGERLLEQMQEIARKQVLISAPVGRFDKTSYDENPHQEHRSTWTPIELKGRGYKVRGYGLRNMLGDHGLLSYFPRSIRQLLTYVVKILPSPLTYFLPVFAGDMVGTKRLNI